MTSRYYLYIEKKRQTNHLERDKQELAKSNFNSLNKANDYVKKLIENGDIKENQQIVAFNNHTGSITYLPKK